jgi:hypothetical protein
MQADALRPGSYANEIACEQRYSIALVPQPSPADRGLPQIDVDQS